MFKFIHCIYLLLIVVLFSSCNMAYNYIKYLAGAKEKEYRELAENHELYQINDGLNRVKQHSDISIWILKNVAFVNEEVDVWDNPETVVKREYGDCEDFALLTMNLAYQVFDFKYDLVLVDSDGDGVEDHATVATGETVYDIYYIGHTVDSPVLYRFTFDEVFNI